MTNRKGQAARKARRGQPVKQAKSHQKQARNQRGRAGDGTFLPGTSGNPKGRPKGKTLAEVYREALEAPSSKEPGMTVAQVVTRALVRHAERGIIMAIRELADRAYGKPRLAIETIKSTDAERWFKLAGVIVKALEPYPEAKQAVLAALDKLEAEDAASGREDIIEMPPVITGEIQV